MFNEVEKYYNLNSPSKKGPRGFLFAYNENGELLFTQENMIVETGRNAIMLNGFDKENTESSSKITSVILGDSSEMTTPEMSGISNMGTHIYEINDRMSTNIFLDDTNGHEYVTSDQKTEFFDTIMSDENSFKSLTIHNKTGNIIYGTNKDILIHTVSAANKDATIDIKGYDNSCFEIFQDTKNLKALVKIFVRRTEDDTENENKDSLSKISSLGLFMGDIMFSRVVFPPYYKSSTQAIVFNYYIYF